MGCKTDILHYLFFCNIVKRGDVIVFNIINKSTRTSIIFLVSKGLVWKRKEIDMKKRDKIIAMLLVRMLPVSSVLVFDKVKGGDTNL